MKKFLLIAMTCLVSYMGQAQVKSTGSFDATQTSQMESIHVQKTEQLKASGIVIEEPSVLTAPETKSEAYSVTPLGEDSEAMICFNTEINHFILNNPASVESYGTSTPEFASSAEYINGMYYISTVESGKLLAVDPETGATSIISTGNNYHFIALCPNNQVFGMSSGYNAMLYTVDITTGDSEVITYLSTMDNFILGFTISNDGRLFAINSNTNSISEFDITTGELISSLEVDFRVNYGQDMATDFSTNEIYWAAYNQDTHSSQLFKVDFDGGNFELIGQFEDQASGFAIRTTSNPNVPAAPEDFVATPIGNELSAKLMWTNPSTTLGGNALTDLTIVLIRDGEIIQEFASAEIGADMTYIDNDIPELGNYRYAVKSMNAEGMGGSKCTEVIVGSMCTYTINCYDGFGNGWLEAAVIVTNEAGDTLGSATIVTGSFATVEIPVPAGVTNLVWKPDFTGGIFDYDCSFEVLYPWGEVMCYYETAPAPGVFYTWTNTCTPTTCQRPTDLITTLVTDNAVTLAWTENGVASTWEIEYCPQGFSQGEGTIVEVTTNPTTLTELDSDVPYTAYVRSICGPDNVSDWSTAVNFHTPTTCAEGLTAISATIGNGETVDFSIPMNTAYNYSYVQELFTAEELVTQGVSFGEINSIALEHFGPQATGADVKIMMSNVNLDDLTGGWYIDEGNMQLVYDGILDLEQGTDFNLEIQLQTPFIYDGENNLLVTFVYARNPHFYPDARYFFHYTNTTMTLTCESNNSPFGLYSPGEAYQHPGRNNMRFNMCTTEPEYVTVSGQVTSSLTNSPVAGASIEYKGPFGKSIITDENGVYTLDLLQQNDYNVTITANGYSTYTATISTPAQTTFEQDFAINQPAIAVNPEEIDAETYFMQNTTQEVTISNNGTGELIWNANCIMDNAENKFETVAHFAMNTDIYNFSLTNPADAIPAGFSHSEFLNSAVYVNGITYFTSSENGMFGTIDYEAGAIETIASGLGIGSITYNAVNDEIVVGTLSQGASFYTIDPTTAEMTHIVTAANQNFVLGCTMSSDGRLFVIDAYSGGISEVNLETGFFTIIWDCGFTINYGQDVEWDFDDNILYWAAFNADINQAQLYAVDIEQNEGTMIGTFAGQASALAIETMAGEIPWMTIEPQNGVIAAGEEASFIVTLNGSYRDNGIFTGNIDLENNTVEGLTTVPVTFTINPSPCDPVTNPAIEVVDYNDIIITWNAPENADGVIAYGIYEYNEMIPFTQVSASEFEFILNDQEPDDYGFRIRAIYEDGCVSISEILLECTTHEPIGTVFGYVTDVYSGETIVGATVIFGESHMTSTNSEGFYSLDLLVGTYNVEISADSYKKLSIEDLYVDVNDNHVDFELISDYAPVNNLTGIYENGTTVLSWDAPTAKSAKDVVLYQGFDSSLPIDWTVIDADGDGNNWEISSESEFDNQSESVPYAGESLIQSASFDNVNYTPLNPDNWLISPAIPINGGEITYYIGAYDNTYGAEHYGVYYSVDGTDPDSFVLLFEETLTGSGKNIQTPWFERSVSLEGIESKDVYIAFRHFDCSEEFILLLDEVTVESNPVTSTLTGYIVERNGEELDMLGVDELSYIDNSVESGKYNYCVTAVYDDMFLSAPACVEVECGLLGDANGDGFVNVADINTMVAYIVELNPPTFVFENADINADDDINILDIQGVVNIIVGKKHATCKIPNVQYQIQNGVLYMNNDAPVSAFQIVFNDSDVRALAFDEYLTASAMTSDGYVFIAYNMEGKVFEAGTHALFHVNGAEVNYFLTATKCGDGAEGVENAFLGIENNKFSDAYPNPFSKSVTVENNANAEFVVTSITGQVVYREATSSNFVWTPANVNSGVYFINVFVDGMNVQTEKVVYQK